MKALVTAIGSILLLNSCVFEVPFESTANIPVNPSLLGLWETAKPKNPKGANRMRVLKHSDNEYLVEYPLGERAMFFRAFAVHLDGTDFIQTQLIGTVDGPVEHGDRKYHLFKITVDGDTMEMSAIKASHLGDDLATPAQMKAAFSARHKDPELFGTPDSFRRTK
ncbi:MAG: hypothetical protein ACNA8L_05800 [Luteolibacter sp.]